MKGCLLSLNQTVEEWDEKNAYREDDEVHRQPHFHEIRKLISTNTLHDEIRLVTNGRGER